jgi:hypothetical protein
MKINEIGRRGLLATLILTGAAARAAAADDLPPAIDQVGVTAARGPERLSATLGLRTALFRGAGYDPFGATDAFTQTSLMASWSFVRGPRFRTAAGVLFEAGSNSAEARGTVGRLSLRRAGVVVEERFVPHPRAQVFGRVAVASLHGTVTVEEPALGLYALGTSFDALSLDASAGVAARFTNPAAAFGGWLTAESGYGWAPTEALTLTPQLAAADRDKAGGTRLGDLSPRGLFLRFAIAVTY